MSLKKAIILALIGASLLGAAGVIFVTLTVPAANWRAHVIWRKANGDIQNIGWRHLIAMISPGSDIYVERLARTPNPYLVIRNPRRSPADVEAGQKLFQKSCASCHGDEAQGGAGGPSLTDRIFKQGRSDWAFFRTITLGVKGTPMVGQDLPEPDVWRIVGYLNSTLSRRASVAPATLASRISALDDDVLLGPHSPGGEWLTYSGSFSSIRHSPLAQVNRMNVKELRVQWLRQVGVKGERLESTPLVHDSVMFMTTGPNRVHALDATTGEVLWTHSRNMPSQLFLCCDVVNRGVALAGDRVYFGTLDAHLVALDAKTGKVVWDVLVDERREGYSITSAPLAVGNRIITGVAGGEFGAPGHLDAYDADTGERLWRLNTVPGPGEPHHDSWEGDSWKTGGVPTWLTGSYDPELKLLYWTTGNPAPNFYGNERSGDNLYSNSVLAIDIETGKLRWHFQFSPHDEHDWDAVQIPMLIDAERPGSSGKLLALANRNAFFYVLDRTDGRFLAGTEFLRQTWADGLDERGRPRARREAIPSKQGALVYPSVTGATNWWSPAYSPRTGLVYVPTLDRGSIYFRAPEDRYRRGRKFPAGGTAQVPGELHVTAVKAIDVATGKVRWERRNAPRRNSGEMGGLLSTEGGLVFGADLERFFALDEETGEELWHLQTGGTVIAAPITFVSGGRQFISVIAGADVITFALPEQPERLTAASN